MTDECPRIIRPVRNAAKYLIKQASVARSLIVAMISHLIPAIAQDENPFSDRNEIPPGYKSAGRIMLGGQCPTETKNIAKILLELKPTDKEETTLLYEFRIEESYGRAIPFEIVNKLVEYYEKKQAPDRKFLAQMLEFNLRLDAAKYGTMEEDLKKLEAVQLDAVDYVTERAEALVKRHRFKEALNEALYCVRISTLGGYINRAGKGFKYPVTGKRWSVLLKKPEHADSMLIKEETLKRLMNVFTTVAPETYAPIISE